MADTTIYT